MKQICIIYYIEINYMFRHYSLAIFKLIMRNLISSYSRFACVVYSGEVKGEVGTRFRTNLTFYLPTIYNIRKSSVTAY